MCKRCVLRARVRDTKEKLKVLARLCIIDREKYSNLVEMIESSDSENLTVAEEVINNLKLNYDKNTSIISNHCSSILG